MRSLKLSFCDCSSSNKYFLISFCFLENFCKFVKTSNFFVYISRHSFSILFNVSVFVLMNNSFKEDSFFNNFWISWRCLKQLSLGFVTKFSAFNSSLLLLILLLDKLLSSLLFWVSFIVIFSSESLFKSLFI